MLNYPLRSSFSILESFARQVETSTDFDSAMDVLAETAAQIGFPMIDYSYLPAYRLRSGEWAPPPVKTRGFPRKWDLQWHRHKVNDPYYHACTKNALWVDWSKVQRSDLTPRESECVNYLADQQLSDGITIPIRLTGGRLAFVSGVWGKSAVRRVDPIEPCATLLYVLAHYFHNAVFAKFANPFRVSSGVLSPRELECLSWIAKGKTAGEVALIIGRSVETVRVHLKRGIAKLGASNCTHAVAKAILLELIEM